MNKAARGPGRRGDFQAGRRMSGLKGSRLPGEAPGTKATKATKAETEMGLFSKAGRAPAALSEATKGS